MLPRQIRQRDRFVTLVCAGKFGQCPLCRSALRTGDFRERRFFVDQGLHFLDERWRPEVDLSLQLAPHTGRSRALVNEGVTESADFELAAPAPLNLVCFHHRGSDEINRQILERLNRSGDIYLTHTLLNGKFTLRLCVGQTQTAASHVERAWNLIQAASQSQS